MFVSREAYRENPYLGVYRMRTIGTAKPSVSIRGAEAGHKIGIW